MKQGEPSRTAMMTAQARGAHRLRDARPWILDDPFGMLLIGPDWRSIGELGRSRYAEEELALVRAFVVARSRYAEDRLEASGCEQYVLLGAGLDSFAWRRPDLARTLRLFEVDHPSTQNWKRARAEGLGLPIGRRHIFAPVDFERDTLEAALSRAGFDWSRPSFFSWLGVTMYITVGASEATLKTVASCAKGSEIVFTYAPEDGALDARERAMRATFTEIATAAGEPPLSSFSPEDLARLIARAGLDLAANPTREDLFRLYFEGRADGLAPYGMERLAAARVG